MQTNLGGDSRIGSGSKMKVDMKTYNRSTFDLGYTWKSTMSAGTLVPFLTEIGLPGDVHEIVLNTDVLTHPTIGPLFGSYKVQLDVYKIPVRLYNRELHMDKLNVGNNMSAVELPLMTISGRNLVPTKPIDNQQINPSSIFSYLGIRGLGFEKIGTGQDGEVKRKFNAGFYLAYFDIFKNFYANKQEQYAWIIHNPLVVGTSNLVSANITTESTFTNENITINGTGNVEVFWQEYDSLVLKALYTGGTVGDLHRYKLEYVHGGVTYNLSIEDLFTEIWDDTDNDTVVCSGFQPMLQPTYDFTITIKGLSYDTIISPETDIRPKLTKFDLTDIDDMRDILLKDANEGTGYVINQDSIEPYCLPFKSTTHNSEKWYSATFNQEGLLVKTYQSDLFNNWVDTEWIDGASGINEISKVDTTGDSFTIDELNIQSKIHKMLMRIGVSGGSYSDWQEAVYSTEAKRRYNEPQYVGGLIKELSFQEVVSNSGTDTQPLGTLAGRGTLTGKHKGGRVTVKCDELCYIMGIVSLTPRVDYSQGNDWHVNLKTADDFHKPALDAIGFQDLVVDQMAYWSTEAESNSWAMTNPVFASAGKQPAWINYMTNVNKVKGNFADRTQQMFMTLNRRYEVSWTSSVYTHGAFAVEDLTTYIDPSKFNHIFADTRLDAQNFWVLINVQNKARRIMSSKVIPNL